MATSSRDRISVDLRGLRAALFEAATARGVSPSALVRTLVATSLGRSDAHDDEQVGRGRHAIYEGRVRLCLRMKGEHAAAIVEAADRAGMRLGDYVGGLAMNVPVLTCGGNHVVQLAALRASCAEMSTLSRNIHRLTSLLRQADLDAARQYRELLDRVADQVRGHLKLAAGALADLQPTRRVGPAASARR